MLKMRKDSFLLDTRYVYPSMVCSALCFLAPQFLSSFTPTINYLSLCPSFCSLLPSQITFSTALIFFFIRAAPTLSSTMISPSKFSIRIINYVSVARYLRLISLIIILSPFLIHSRMISFQVPRLEWIPTFIQSTFHFTLEQKPIWEAEKGKMKED